MYKVQCRNEGESMANPVSWQWYFCSTVLERLFLRRETLVP